MFSKLLSKFLKPRNQLKIFFSILRERVKRRPFFINGLHFFPLIVSSFADTAYSYLGKKPIHFYEKNISIVIDKISCGQSHSLLLSRNGDIYAFEMATKNNEFQTTPIKINNLTHIRAKNEKTESSQAKSFRENKFIDIATHSHYDISIALSVNGIYYVWSNYYFPKPEETDFKSFDEILKRLGFG
jgi:hypothetical protein